MNFFFGATTGTYLESSKVEQFQILASEGEQKRPVTVTS